MDREKIDPEKALEEVMAKANAIIRRGADELMDINHDTIMSSREIIMKLREFRERYEEIIGNMITTHAIAANEMAALYADMIMAETGAVELDIDDEAFEDDEEATDDES